MCDRPLNESEASCALIDDVIEESLITSVGCALSMSGAAVASAANGASAASEHATAAVSVGVFFMIVSLGGAASEARENQRGTVHALDVLSLPGDILDVGDSMCVTPSSL